MIFNRLKYIESGWIGTRESIFLMAVFDVCYPEYERDCWIHHFSTICQGTHICLKRLAKNYDISCLQIHEKDEFLHAFQVLVPQFRFDGTLKPHKVNADGSAVCIHKNLLLDGGMVTHVVTCQGRDHIVNIQSGDRNLVITIGHFEADLTLGNPRERLRLITPHWPLYAEAYGSFQYLRARGRKIQLVESDSSQMVMRGKTALFRSFSPTSSKLPSLTSQGETLKPTVLYAHCPGLKGVLSVSFWLKHETSTATPTFLRILGNGPYRVTMQLYVSVFKKPKIRSHQGKRIPSWMSKHPCFFSVLNQIHPENGPFMSVHVRHRAARVPSFLTASIAFSAYRSRHLGTLVHCCEAWELDTDGKRQRFGEVQTWSSRLAFQETNALPSRCWR